MFQAQYERVAAEASHHDLGAAGRVYRCRRTLPMRMVWLVTGVAAGLALLAFATGHGLLGSFIVPLTLLGVLAYVYFVPPAGGRRWVALYERGVVEVSTNFWQRPRAARWEAIRSVVHEPAPARRTVVVFDSVRGDEPVVIPIDAVDRRQELVDAVERHMAAVGAPPPYVDRRRFRRTVAVLAVLAVIPGAGYGAYASVTEPAESAESVSSGRSRLDGWNPTMGAPGGSLPVAPEPTPTIAPPPAPIPPPPPDPLPTHIAGFGDLCDPKPVGFPGAARYAGRGLHPVWFAGDGSYYFEEGDVPARWRTEDLRKVQLVACIDDVATGSVIRRCYYDTDDGVKAARLRWQSYRIRLYEARTARRLTSVRMLGRNTKCPYVVIGTRGEPLDDEKSQLTAGDIRAAIGRYIG